MSEPEERAELVVIGGGPGGYAAAFAAADHGLAVTLIERRDRLGGVCLHAGCIPSKTLLHAARLLMEAREAAHWGIAFPPPALDLARLRAWKDEVIGKLSGGVDELCQRRKVRRLIAQARFRDAHTLELTDAGGAASLLRFEQAIVATGARPIIPEPLALDGERVMDSSKALQLPEVPERLLVVGGGYIGLELGTVYAALGSQVVVVELTAGLLPGVDRDLVRPLQRRLETLFAAVHLNTRVERLQSLGTRIEATLRSAGQDRVESFDRVLVAVGRRPNTAGVGLEQAGVALDGRGFIRVNDKQQTSMRHIYAIGDAAGEPMLAHKASWEAKTALRAILGQNPAHERAIVPAVVFTDPEIAWCGMTEAEAKGRDQSIGVLRYPWAASGRAQTLGRIDGLTKLVYDTETQEVLGVGIVGPGAGELIAEGTLAVQNRMFVRDLAHTIHTHPTLAETLGESAEAILGQATHLYRPRR